MTTKRTPQHAQVFWKQQLKTAEKRLEAFEGEAQKVLAELTERGRKTRTDIQELLRRAGETDLSGRAEEIRAQFEKGSAEVLRKLEALQGKALGALGVAGRAQVEELAQKVQRLSKKINKMGREGREGPAHESRRAV